MMDVTMTLHADLYHSPIAIITTATMVLCVIVLMWINRGVTELSRNRLMERLRHNTNVSFALHMPKAVDAEGTYKEVYESVKPKIKELRRLLAGTASARDKLKQLTTRHNHGAESSSKIGCVPNFESCPSACNHDAHIQLYIIHAHGARARAARGMIAVTEFLNLSKDPRTSKAKVDYQQVL
jgi:hypothetical protein